MYLTCLIKLSLISCVVGIINVDKEKLTQTLDRTKNELLKNTSVQLPCKEHLLKSNSFFSPSHAIPRDTPDHVAHFNMHIAIETDKSMRIRLMDKEHFLDTDNRYYICVGCENNQYTDLYKFGDYYTRVQRNNTPGILSPTDFKAFYLKIDDGKLEFGEEGSAPLISYEDANLGLVNHFQFYYFGEKEARIRYHCPAPGK